MNDLTLLLSQHHDLDSDCSDKSTASAEFSASSFYSGDEGDDIDELLEEDEDEEDDHHDDEQVQEEQEEVVPAAGETVEQTANRALMSPKRAQSGGLLLAAAMHRNRMGSESDLPSTLMQDPNARAILHRHGSDNAMNRSAKITYCIQTASATEAKSAAWHQQDQELRRPVDVLNEIFHERGLTPATRSADSLTDFWVPWNTRGYTKDLTDAIRQDDLAMIQKLHEAGHNLQCCNLYGESVVHTAARRGTLDILQFMVQVGVSIRVCCEQGRNPIHDACWTTYPNFECVAFLLRLCPDLLLLTDKRGLTPLQYAPRDTWDLWADFLTENVDLVLMAAGTPIINS